MSEDNKDITQRDGEMPDGASNFQPADDGKYHVPSQFSSEPDGGVHERFSAGIFVTYKRNDEDIAYIDATDYAISNGMYEGINPQELGIDIVHMTRGVAQLTYPSGLQAGDVEVVEQNGKVIATSTLTQEQIEENLKRVAEFQNQATNTVAIAGIDDIMQRDD